MGCQPTIQLSVLNLKSSFHLVLGWLLKAEPTLQDLQDDRNVAPTLQVIIRHLYPTSMFKHQICRRRVL